MTQRLPLILSATALVVALVGSTPLGRAAELAIERVVPRAKTADFAKNAGRLNGRQSSLAPKAGQIPVVGSDGRLPASIVAAAPAAGPSGVTGYQLVEERVTIPDGEEDFRRVVACPGGKVVLAGGFDFEADHAADLILFDSHPVSNREWRFRIRNDTGGQKANKTLYVVCATAGG
jgi:hypothetical protein